MSKRAPSEPWIPWSCREVWGEGLVQPNHSENERRDQKVSILDRLDMKVLRLAIWQHNTHVFDLLKYEPNIFFIGEGGRPRITKSGGKI